VKTEEYKVGSVVAVTVLREGKREQVKVTLEALN
jgi:S1-C subfamily serine protease